MILKLRQEGVRGDCEVSFYQLLNRISDLNYEANNKEDSEEPFPANSVVTTDQVLCARIFAKFIPKFYGLRQIPIDDEPQEFLTMEDITVPYSRPAIMDIKIGKMTYDPNASEKKIKSEIEKYPPQKTLGFRLLGYRVHNIDGTVEVRGKDWGKSKDETNIGLALFEFFGVRKEAAALALRKICLFREWFAHQTLYHFYASSLLFIFENSPDMDINLDVRMIDFGHVFPGNGELDENYTHGLDNLISLLEEMLLKSA